MYVLCSSKSESFRISRTPPSNPTIVVLGENSAQVSLAWELSDAPNNYFVQFWRRKPGEDLKQIAIRTNGNAFHPGSTSEFKASLPATLTLKNVERNEEYSYTITLLNSQAVEVARDTVTIDVVVPPEITVPPTPTPLLTIGENYTLTCNASGDPFPKITWTKDGTPAEEFNVTGYKLHFTNVELKDVGSYRCTASNGYGHNATSVSVASIRCNDCDIKTVGIILRSETWKSALNNQQSVEFKILQANVLSEISKVYAKNPGKKMYSIDLVAFRSGSVVAEVEMKFGKSVTDPLKPLEDDIKDGKLGAFTVNCKLDLNITTPPPASLFSTATPPPVSLFSTTSEEPDQPSSNAPNSGLTPSELWGIIGGCIAFVLVVLIIIVVSSIYCRKNKGGGASKGGRKKYSEVGGYLGNLRHHRREDRIEIQVQECPQENQHTRCTNVGVDLMLNDERSPTLQSQSSGNPTYEQILVSSEYMPLNQATKSRIWEIRREQVHIMEMIGKGAFSQVAKAVAFLNING
ncbi:protein turtle-like, partial [Stylophora pistillata]|uniref:protein turtle-like n=1 Tax=Stylophora pistillata TaxID=50429 RepID=UPI000C043D86